MSRNFVKQYDPLGKVPANSVYLPVTELSEFDYTLMADPYQTSPMALSKLIERKLGENNILTKVAAWISETGIVIASREINTIQCLRAQGLDRVTVVVARFSFTNPADALMFRLKWL